MSMYSDDEIAAILAKAEEHATKLESDAAYGGERHDGGAGRLRDALEAYRHGMNRTIPRAWGIFAKEVRREQDPDYAEYQRLKEKFE